MAKLSLTWPIDREGYHVEEYVADGESRAAKTIAGSAGGTRIVRNGRPLDFIDALKMDGLYRRLADCHATEQGAHDFVQRYGFLRSKHSFETVDFICNEIQALRGLLKLKHSGNWERLRLWVIDTPKVGLLRPELLGG